MDVSNLTPQCGRSASIRHGVDVCARAATGGEHGVGDARWRPAVKTVLMERAARLVASRH